MTAAVISDRKRAANRANAAKSTGPRSIEGKKRSASNALKHGLRSEIVVLPTEDAAAFEASRDAWISDWQPASEAAATLVERAVAGAWRLRRCVRLETDRLAERGRRAIADHDDQARRKLAFGREALANRPEHGVDFLRTFWEGIDFMRQEWRQILQAATLPGDWNDYDTHHVRALNLMGFEADSDDEEAIGFRETSLRILHFHGGDLDRDFSDEGLNQGAIDALGMKIIRLAYAKIDELEGALAAMPHPDVDRARVADAAALDDSLEGVTLARYEASHDRAFRATLNALIKMTDRDGKADRFDEGDATNEPTEVALSGSDRPATNEATEVAVVPDRHPCRLPNEATEVSGDDPQARFAPDEATVKAVDGEPAHSEIAAEEVSPNEATEDESGEGLVTAAGVIARRLREEELARKEVA